MQKNLLENYNFVYQITCLPTIIFSQMVPCIEPLKFDEDFFIPPELSGMMLEVRICIYETSSGDLVDMNSKMLPASSPVIRNYANIIPLSMLEKLAHDLIKAVKLANKEVTNELANNQF